MMEYADGWTIGVLDALIDAAVVCGDTDCEVALIRWIAYVAEAHPELVNPDHIRDYIQSNRLDSSPYDSVMALLRSEYTTAKHRKRDSGHSDIETRRTVSDKICRVLRLDMVCTLCVSWATFFMPYRSGQCITNPRKKNLLCHIDVLRCLSNRITPVEYTFRTIGFKRPSRDIFHMHSLERKSPEIQIPALDSATIANIELDTHTDITPTRIRCHTIGTKNIPIVQQQQQTLPHSDFIISEYGTQFSVPQITVGGYKRNVITLL